MKYFKLNLQVNNLNNRIVSSVDGEKIPNVDFFFNKLRDGDFIINPPVFDYFYLKSFDEKSFWDFKLNDVHSFINQGSQIKGLFISEKLKKIFEKHILANPYQFYLSKLLYKFDSYDYYIFQFAGNMTFENFLLNINFKKSIFYNPKSEEDVFVINNKEFIDNYKRIYKENDSLELILKNRKLVLNEAFDFFPMATFMKDNIVSNKLKKAIEDNNIQGFEFSELDYNVVIDQNI